MSEERPRYEVNNRMELEDLPEPIRPTLRYIANHPTSEPGLILLQYAASFVHPDYVCNLVLLDHLPIPAKEAALEMFEYCLTCGLSLEERGSILQILNPYLGQMLNAPLPR